MKIIESLSNPFVVQLYKLHEKKYRDASSLFLVEGEHLVSEAQKAKLLNAVLITNENEQFAEVENYLVTTLIMNKLSQTKSPPTIIGVCKYFSEPQIKGSRFLLLDNLQDPGNIGTLVRSALGFCVDLVVLNSQSVDIYNDKLIRSTQGALFHIPIVKANLLEIVLQLKKQGITVINTNMMQGMNLYEYQPSKKWALILGNEGQGVQADLMALADGHVYIPMQEKLESLNVAVAGSIILSYFNQFHC
jgi:TrmH family RNA methyltransferase